MIQNKKYIKIGIYFLCFYIMFIVVNTLFLKNKIILGIYYFNQIESILSLEINILLSFTGLIFPILLLSIELIGKQYKYLIKLIIKETNIFYIIYFTIISILLYLLFNFVHPIIIINNLGYYFSIFIFLIIIYICIGLISITINFSNVFSDNYWFKIIEKKIDKILYNKKENYLSDLIELLNELLLIIENKIYIDNNMESLKWINLYLEKNSNLEFIEEYLIKNYSNTLFYNYIKLNKTWIQVSSATD